MRGISRPSPHRSRYNRRTLGQADASASFDVQGTLSTVRGAQAAASNVQSAIQQYGDTSEAAVQQNTWSGVVAGYNEIVPGSGTVLDQIYQNMPHAASGPGECVTDPPDPANLSAWKYFKSWETVHGSYIQPPGTFEAWAYPLIKQNAAFEDNCFPQFVVPWAVELASLVAGWNATHYGPTTTTTRSNLRAWGGTADPLAYAMAMATLPPTAPGQFFSAGQNVGPDSVSVQINRGAQHPKVFTSLLHLTPASAPVAAAHPVMTSTSSMTQVVLVGGSLAALGLVAFRMSKHLPALPRHVRALRDLVR